MSVAISRITLLEVAGKVPIDAELREAILEQQLNDWEAEWRPFLYDKIREMHRRHVPRSEWPQNSHWDWRRKTAGVQGLLGCAGCSVTCHDTTQGLMQLDLTGTARLAVQHSKPLVYIEYLEAAPWNRPELSSPPRYRGVGSALVTAAITISQREGFKGRIGLHALPQAERFYGTTCSMSDLGPDITYHGNLRYFEMTPEQAEAFVT